MAYAAPPAPGSGVAASPAVVELATSREGECQLRVAPTQVEIQRDQRQPLLLDPPDQTPDLGTLQEELARALRIGIPVRRRLVRTDVQFVEPHFAALQTGKSILEAHLARAHRLHLRPLEDQTRFERLEHLILVPGFPVAGNDESAPGFRLGTLPHRCARQLLTVRR